MTIKNLDDISDYKRLGFREVSDMRSFKQKLNE